MFLSQDESCGAESRQAPALTDDWRRARLSSPADVPRTIEGITGALRGAAFTPRDIFGVRLALEEAIVNAIKHGHQYDSAKQVEIRYRIGDAQVVVEVEDEGPGFDPLQVPDPTAAECLERPSGRGLLLIRRYTTWVRFSAQGNCITFCKRASASGS